MQSPSFSNWLSSRLYLRSPSRARSAWGVDFLAPVVPAETPDQDRIGRPLRIDRGPGDDAELVAVLLDARRGGMRDGLVRMEPARQHQLRRIEQHADPRRLDQLVDVVVLEAEGGGPSPIPTMSRW